MWRGCSSMAERQLPKLHTRVRFPSPAPAGIKGALPLNRRDPRQVSRETRLADYVALLQHWHRTINLTSRADSDESRLFQHIENSLAVVPYLPDKLDRLIDLGSGQGLPAIPIAITTGIRIELIEANRRKAAFLTTALSKLQLSGHVWPTRIQLAKIEPAQCVTARALAPLSVLVRLSRPFVRPDGCCLFLKGRSALVEIEQLGDALETGIELLPLEPQGSCLVKIFARR